MRRRILSLFNFYLRYDLGRVEVKLEIIRGAPELNNRSLIGVIESTQLYTLELYLIESYCANYDRSLVSDEYLICG